LTAELPVIRVRDVAKTYKLYRRRETTLKEVILRRRRGVWEAFRALDGVSFEVGAGEAVGIVGRNGSGKSTMLKLLARILEPNRGSVTTHGRVSALLELGAGFHPDYTAIENIYLNGAIYGLSRAWLSKRIDEIIEFAELERFADNPVKTYSSGMYARLGFSIAVNVDPDILLIDEVLAVGDQSFQTRCFDRMLEFRDAGKTLILVTHDLSAVQGFCNRAIWIDGGHIRMDGPPRVVVKSYADEVNAGEELWSAGRTRDRDTAIMAHRPINPSVPIVLAAMSFSGADDAAREVFHNGEELRIRVHYVAQNPVRSPICEVEIFKQDGTHVTTASTATGALDTGDVLEGEGFFRWSIGDTALTPGVYYFTARIRDRSGKHVLDEQERWYRISVQPGVYLERGGCAILPGQWSHERTAEGQPSGVAVEDSVA
jgi:ABC-type polysaccharide/polyol phosphate transport system ATPase subunit